MAYSGYNLLKMGLGLSHKPIVAVKSNPKTPKTEKQKVNQKVITKK